MGKGTFQQQLGLPITSKIQDPRPAAPGFRAPASTCVQPAQNPGVPAHSLTSPGVPGGKKRTRGCTLRVCVWGVLSKHQKSREICDDTSGTKGDIGFTNRAGPSGPPYTGRQEHNAHGLPSARPLASQGATVSRGGTMRIQLLPAGREFRKSEAKLCRMRAGAMDLPFCLDTPLFLAVCAFDLWASTPS